MTTSFGATVKWLDNGNLYNTRPAADDYRNSVTLWRYKAGADVETQAEAMPADSFTVVDNGDGTYSVQAESLPAYAPDGTKYYYCISQEPVKDVNPNPAPGTSAVKEFGTNAHYVQVYDNSNNSFTNITDFVYDGGLIDNTLSATRKVSLTHEWRDGDASDDERRAANSQVHLYRTSEEADGTVDLYDAPVSGLTTQDTPLATNSSFDYTAGAASKDAVVPVFDPEGKAYVYYVRETLTDESGYTSLAGKESPSYDTSRITGEGTFILSEGTYVTKRDAAVTVTGSKEYRIASLQGSLAQYPDEPISATLALRVKVKGSGDAPQFVDSAWKDGKLTFPLFGYVKYSYDAANSRFTIDSPVAGWPNELSLGADGRLTYVDEDDGTTKKDFGVVVQGDPANPTSCTWRRAVVLDSFTAETLRNSEDVMAPECDDQGLALEYSWVEYSMSILGLTETADPGNINGLKGKTFAPSLEKGNMGPGVGDKRTTLKFSSEIDSEGTVINTLLGDTNVKAQKNWYTNVPEDVTATMRLYLNGLPLDYETASAASFPYASSVVLDTAAKKVYLKSSYYTGPAKPTAAQIQSAVDDGTLVPVEVTLPAASSSFKAYGDPVEGQQRYTSSATYTWKNLPRYTVTGEEISYDMREIEHTPSNYYLGSINYKNSVVTVENVDPRLSKPDEIEIMEQRMQVSNTRVASTGSTHYSWYVEKNWLDGSDLDCRKDVVMDLVRVADGQVNLLDPATDTYRPYGKGEVVRTLTVSEGTNWMGLMTITAKTDEGNPQQINPADYVVVERSMGGTPTTLGTLLTPGADGSLGTYDVDALIAAGVGQADRNVRKANGSTLFDDDAVTQADLDASYRLGTVGEMGKDDGVSHLYNVFGGWYTDRYGLHYISYNQRSGEISFQVEKTWQDGDGSLDAKIGVFRQIGEYTEDGTVSTYPVFEQVDATKAAGTEDDPTVTLRKDDGIALLNTQGQVVDPGKQYDYAVIEHPTKTDETLTTVSATWKSDGFAKYDKKGQIYTYELRETDLLSGDTGKSRFSLCETGMVDKSGLPQTRVKTDVKGGDVYTVTVGATEISLSEDHNSGDVYSIGMLNKRDQKYPLHLNVVWRDNGEKSHTSTMMGESLPIGSNEKSGVSRPDVSVRVYRTTVADLKVANGSLSSTEAAVNYLSNATAEQLSTLIDSGAVQRFQPTQAVWNTTTGSDFWWSCDLGKVDRFDAFGNGYIYFVQQALHGNASQYDGIYFNTVKTVSLTSGFVDETGVSKDYRPTNNAITATYDAGNPAVVTSESQADKRVEPQTTTESFVPQPQTDEKGTYLPSGTWNRDSVNWSDRVLILSDGGGVTTDDDTTAEEYSRYYSSTIVNYIRGHQALTGNKVWKLANGNYLPVANLPEVTLELYVSYRSGLTKLADLKKDGAYVDTAKASMDTDYKFGFPNNIGADATALMKHDGVEYPVALYSQDESGNQVLPRFDQWGRRLYYYVMEKGNNSEYNTNYSTPQEITSGDLTVTNIYHTNPKTEKAQYTTVRLSKDWEGSEYRDPQAKTTFKLYAQYTKKVTDIFGKESYEPVPESELAPEHIATFVLEGVDTDVLFDEVNVKSCTIYNKDETRIPYYAPNGNPYLYHVVEVTPDGYTAYVGGTDGQKTDRLTDFDEVFMGVTADGKDVVLTPDENGGFTYTTGEGEGKTVVQYGGVVTTQYTGKTTLVNNFEPPSQTVSVTKKWDDFSNQLSTRPEGLVYTVKARLGGQDDVRFTMTVELKKAADSNQMEATLLKIEPGKTDDLQGFGFKTEQGGLPNGVIVVAGDENLDHGAEYRPSVRVQTSGASKADYANNNWEIFLEGLPTFTPSSETFAYTISEAGLDNDAKLANDYVVDGSKTVQSAQAEDKVDYILSNVSFTNSLKKGTLELWKNLYVETEDGTSVKIDESTRKQLANLLRVGALPETLSFAVQYKYGDGDWGYLPWNVKDEFVTVNGQNVMGGTLQTEDLYLYHFVGEWDVPLFADNGVDVAYRVIELDAQGTFKNVLGTYKIPAGKDKTTTVDAQGVAAGADTALEPVDGSTVTFAQEKDVIEATVDDYVGGAPIKIRKVWQDKHNQDNTRPESLTITLSKKDDANKSEVFELTQKDATSKANVWESEEFYLPLPSPKPDNLQEYFNQNYVITEVGTEQSDQEALEKYELAGADPQGGYTMAPNFDSTKLESGVSVATLTNSLSDDEAKEYNPKTVTVQADKIFDGDAEWVSLARPEVTFELFCRKAGQTDWIPVSDLAGSDYELQDPSYKRDRNYPFDLDGNDPVKTVSVAADQTTGSASWVTYQYWWQTTNPADTADMVEIEYGVRETIQLADGKKYQSKIYLAAAEGEGYVEPSEGANDSGYELTQVEGYGATAQDGTPIRGVGFTNTLVTTSRTVGKDWGALKDGNFVPYGFSDKSKQIQKLIDLNAIPQTITFGLYVGQDQVATKDFAVADLAAGALEWADLPLRDKDGKQISYTIKEESGVFQNGDAYDPIGATGTETDGAWQVLNFFVLRSL
ncbi:MAG: Cna B-type domain-containing protein [Coriobacteriia bacterium]|nr:Cna B-type domain-containing protein [Coriobacteriia bacterium]